MLMNDKLSMEKVMRIAGDDSDKLKTGLLGQQALTPTHTVERTWKRGSV